MTTTIRGSEPARGPRAEELAHHARADFSPADHEERRHADGARRARFPVF